MLSSELATCTKKAVKVLIRNLEKLKTVQILECTQKLRRESRRKKCGLSATTKKQSLLKTTITKAGFRDVKSNVSNLSRALRRFDFKFTQES